MNKVFISFKNSYNGVLTRDSAIAQSLCEALRKKDLTVFFSNTSLREVGADRYMDKIEEEICSADAMVVVGTQSEYVSRGWVRQEWMTFLNISLSNTEKSLYTYVPEPGDVQTFPAFLRPYQSFKTEEDAITFISNKFLLQDELSRQKPSLQLFWNKYYGLFGIRDVKSALKMLSQLSFPKELMDALTGEEMILRKDKSGMEFLLSSVRKGCVAGYYLAAHNMITGKSGERRLGDAKALLVEGFPHVRERRNNDSQILFLVWTSLNRLSRAIFCAEMFCYVMEAYGVLADVLVYRGQTDLSGQYHDVVFLLGEDSFSTDENFMHLIEKYRGNSFFMLNGFSSDAVPRAVRKHATSACEDADIGSISRYLITKYAKQT